MRGHIPNRARRGRSPVGPPGSVLVVTVLLVGLLFVMAMTMINLASSDYQVATNESRSIQALFNADAGIEEAKMRLSPNAPVGAAIPVGVSTTWRAYILSGHTQAEIENGLDPTYGKVPPAYTATQSTSDYVFYNTVQTGTGSIPWGWLRIEHKVDSTGNPVYLNPTNGATTTNASQTVGTVVINNPPIVVVTAEGIQGPVRRMIAMEYRPIVSTTTTTDYIATDPFADAVHGRGQIRLIGNANTDSYNSANGPYGPSNRSNGHGSGDVSTDGTGEDIIQIGANSTVDGSALIGPVGGSVSDAIDVGSHGSITGTQGREPAVWNMPLSQIPTGTINSGPLSLSGNSTRTLSTGTYWFTSINITGNGQLNVSGAVKIYVTGTVDIGGNGIVQTGSNPLPQNLFIYGTAANLGDPTHNVCTSISIHGNGNFYGAVYAPSAAVSVSGNGSVFGSLTGNTVTINGSGGANFHYDEALGNLGRFLTETTSTTYTTTGYTRYSWREIAF